MHDALFGRLLLHRQIQHGNGADAHSLYCINCFVFSDLEHKKMLNPLLNYIQVSSTDLKVLLQLYMRAYYARS